MTTTPQKTTIALALTLFMVLAGTGVGQAFWSAQATTTSGVSAGVIGVSQSGFESLQITYDATVLVAAAPITVTNTGTITAPHTLTLAAQSASALASGARVRTWVATAASECTASAEAPPGATDTNWANIPAMTGTLAPSGERVYCVLTSITSSQQASLAATSMVGTLNLVSALGLWTASATAVTPTHTVTDTAAPSVPGAPIASATSGTQTTLTWAASTDNVGVTAYDVFRGGALLATVTSPTFIDTGLSAGGTYAYTTTATDAAGNLSGGSAVASVTTLALTPTADYSVKPITGTNLCLNHSGNVPGNGAPLVTVTCQGNSQPWNVVHIAGGHFYKIVFPHASKLFAWEIVGNSSVDGAGAQLWTDTGAANQQWEIVQQGGGVYSLVNRVSGKCLEAPPAFAVLGTQLSQKTCSGSIFQNFLLVP